MLFTINVNTPDPDTLLVPYAFLCGYMFARSEKQLLSFETSIASVTFDKVIDSGSDDSIGWFVIWLHSSKYYRYSGTFLLKKSTGSILAHVVLNVRMPLDTAVKLDYHLSQEHSLTIPRRASIWRLKLVHEDSVITSECTQYSMLPQVDISIITYFARDSPRPRWCLLYIVNCCRSSTSTAYLSNHR